ncbi:type II toxin-antitoxin system Phd/YefM family antitoxin [Nocardia brasiliensis]|uniref:type II toxin-antitoxin system Phd/YefM family antitoxin n=1 Tax=Nocardia brasiliensis TaxID=37326 RepID=UPI00366D6992
MPNTNTRNLHELSADIGTVIRDVVATGEDAIITDGGTEVAVIMSMADYERLHLYAELADAARPGYAGSTEFRAMSISEMLDLLGVHPTVVRNSRG